MSSFMDYVYGPLSEKYCTYFYLLSVLGFLLLVFTILSVILMTFSKKRGSDFYGHMFMIALGYGIFYFQNRLLYSMCVDGSKRLSY